MELQHIHTRIHLLRSQRVMLDFDLAGSSAVEACAKPGCQTQYQAFPTGLYVLLASFSQ